MLFYKGCVYTACVFVAGKVSSALSVLQSLLHTQLNTDLVYNDMHRRTRLVLPGVC